MYAKEKKKKARSRFSTYKAASAVRNKCGVAISHKTLTQKAKNAIKNPSTDHTTFGGRKKRSFSNKRFERTAARHWWMKGLNMGLLVEVVNPTLKQWRMVVWQHHCRWHSHHKQTRCLEQGQGLPFAKIVGSGVTDDAPKERTTDDTFSQWVCRWR